MATIATPVPHAAEAEDRTVGRGTLEEVTFLELAAETGGRRTLVEARLEPGAGNPLHVHARFAETFEVLDGVLTVERDGEVLHAGAGEVVEVPAGTAHRFANDSDAPTCFRCAIEPGNRGFEEMLQLGDGLARDGRVTKAGLPRDPRHVALMLTRSETAFAAGPARVVGPLVLGALAALGRRTGEEERLLARYVRF